MNHRCQNGRRTSSNAARTFASVASALRHQIGEVRPARVADRLHRTEPRELPLPLKLQRPVWDIGMVPSLCVPAWPLQPFVSAT
jgi:hypothetical protein